jgi:hypothetical protein
VKEIPSSLHAQQKRSAKKHRRSLNSEVIALLEQSMGSRRGNSDDLLDTARRFRSTLTFEATDDEISEAKRQGRS